MNIIFTGILNFLSILKNKNDYKQKNKCCPAIVLKRNEKGKAISVKRKFDGAIFNVGDLVAFCPPYTNKPYYGNTKMKIKFFTINFENDKNKIEFDHISVGFEHTTCYVLSLEFMKHVINKSS